MELKGCKTAVVAKAEEEEVERDSQHSESESGSWLSEAPAGILVEILIRLPHCKQAFQFKLVSKRWNSILSDPSFLRRAAAFHRHHYGGGGFFTLIFQLFTNSENKTPVLALDVPKRLDNGCVRHLDLDRLIGRHDLKIAASCNDLLLVEPHLNKNDYEYYVVNVLTHEWIALPPAPAPAPSMPALGAHAYFKLGLLCHYDYDSLCYSTFKVFRIPCVSTKIVDFAQTSPIPGLDHTEFSVHIYSSDSKQWCQYTADWYPFRLTHYLTNTPIVSHNGMFHWVNDRALLSLNPFDLVFDDHHHHGDTGAPLRLRLNSTVELPDFHHGEVSQLLGIGVVRDHMRIITEQIDGDHRRLLVWRLDDSKIGAADADADADGSWSLVHIASISEFPFMTISRSFDFLACHPYEGDVLLVQILNSIYQINLHTQEFREPTGDPYYQVQGNCYLMLPPLLHQWFPTPLTSLSPNSPL